MENKTNIFENWADAQTKLFENWSKTSQDFQKNFSGNNPFEKGSEMLNDWMQKGRESFNSFTGQGSENGNPSADQFKQYFTQWMEMQNKASEMWMDAGKKMSSMFTEGNNTNWFDQAKKYQEGYMNPFQNMFGMMNNNWNTNWNDGSAKTMTDAFAAMQKGADSYMKFYELWQPVMTAMQDNTPKSMDELRNMMDPKRFKEFMDKMFNFDAIKPMNEYMNQYGQQMAQAWEQGQKMFPAMQQWSEAMKNGMPQGNLFIQDSFRQMYAEYQKSVSPFFRLTQQGKQKEMSDLTEDTFEKYAEAANKLTALQQMIYMGGAKALEQMLATTVEKAKEGVQYKDTTELYNDWINMSGQTFESLFATEDFSKLQGELVALDVQIRGNMEKQMEMMLAPYPVVLRSQLDEVIKSNYDLKKRVHELEKQLNSTIAVEENADVTASKTATTRKKA